MAYSHNIKISCSLLHTLKNKLNLRKSIKHLCSWSNLTLNRTATNLTEAISSKEKECEELEEADDRTDTKSTFQNSTSIATNRNQSSRLDYMKFRQLQPANYPDFLHSCFKEVVSLNEHSTIKPPLRSDSLNLEIKNVGSAVPFIDRKSEDLPSNDFKTSSVAIEGIGDIKLMNMLTRKFSSKTVSPDPEKCKKMDGKKKTECKKIKMDCPPTKSYKCIRREHTESCTKQESPYPSYSEACHEEWEEKPDECKMCPWPLKKHPTFKPPKKKFHTMSNDIFTKQCKFNTRNDDYVMRKDDCPPPPKPKEPCGWVEEERARKAKEERNEEKKKKSMSLSLIENSNIFDHFLKVSKFVSDESPIVSQCIPREKPTAMSLFKTAFNYKIPKRIAKLKLPVSKKANVLNDEITTLFSRSLGYSTPEFIVNKKKPCDKPPPKCPENKKKPKKDKKCIQINSQSVFAEKDDAQQTPCKKFPFPTPPRIQHEKKEDGNRCKEKKKRKIKDCPAQKTDECQQSSSLINSIILADKNKDKNEKKCPKIDLGKCEDIKESEDDPCGLKKTGVTRQCPADLTKRKRKYKPKTKKDATKYVPPNHTYDNQTDAPHL